MNFIEGYKAFNKNFETFNGMKFKEKDIKHTSGTIKAGPIDGNGFHICLNFEDTFRYVDTEEKILCEVIGYGNISKEYTDDYYGYYDIYACSDIYIKKIVSRQEIIEMAKQLPTNRLERLIKTYKMTDKEINQITRKDVIKTINYYHYNDRDAFRRKENG